MQATTDNEVNVEEVAAVLWNNFKRYALRRTIKYAVFAYLIGLLTYPLIQVAINGYTETRDEITDTFCSASDYIGATINYCETSSEDGD